MEQILLKYFHYILWIIFKDCFQLIILFFNIFNKILFNLKINNVEKIIQLMWDYEYPNLKLYDIMNQY